MMKRFWLAFALVACGGPDYETICFEQYKTCQVDALVANELEMDEAVFKEAIIRCVERHNECIRIYVEDCAYVAGEGKVCEE